MTTAENNDGESHDTDWSDIDPAIREEGYQAGEAGKQWFDCPYPSTTRESLSWMAGLVESVRQNESSSQGQPITPGDR